MGTAYIQLLATGCATYQAGNPAADDAAHAVRSILDLYCAQSRPMRGAPVTGHARCVLRNWAFWAVTGGA